MARVEALRSHGPLPLGASQGAHSHSGSLHPLLLLLLLLSALPLGEAQLTMFEA